MKEGNIKIIPLLVFVAMLAFSVHLVDIVTGISSLSGAAYAEDEGGQAHNEEPKGEEQSSSAGNNTTDKTPAEGGLVFAEEKPAEVEPPPLPAEGHEEAESPQWRDPVDEDPQYSAVKMELFDELATRRKELDAREQSLGVREALLKAAGQEIDRKYQEMSQLRQELEGLLNKQKTEEEARIQSLVKIYEGMKPKDAARIFDTLDIDILVSVVSQMSERKLSPILATMNPERARTVTIMLAEQKQLPALP